MFKTSKIEFLITQCEQRINMVDTKAAIIVAVVAVFTGIFTGLDSAALIGHVIPTYAIYLLGLIGILIFFGTAALIITLRPIGSVKEYLKIRKKKERNHKGYWLHSMKAADEFRIDNVEDHIEAMEELLKELTKRRILKYRFFRWSMWFMRMALLGIFILLIWTGIHHLIV